MSAWTAIRSQTFFKEYCNNLYIVLEIWTTTKMTKTHTETGFLCAYKSCQQQACKED